MKPIFLLSALLLATPAFAQGVPLAPSIQLQTSEETDVFATKAAALSVDGTLTLAPGVSPERAASEVKLIDPTVDCWKLTYTMEFMGRLTRLNDYQWSIGLTPKGTAEYRNINPVPDERRYFAALAKNMECK